MTAVDVTTVAPGIAAREAIDRWKQPVDVRSRTVTWADPYGSVVAAASMSGREIMEAIARGELAPPPMALLLGFAPSRIDHGHVTMSFHPGEHTFNPLGSVHGGALATLLDSSMGCAIQTTLPAGVAYATSDLQVRYVRPVLAGTPMLHATGEVVHRGRRLATAEGRIVDDTGKLYAHATTSCQLFDIPTSS
jgi:uncharacterized protein (TIGR00369 family)